MMACRCRHCDAAAGEPATRTNPQPATCCNLLSLRAEFVFHLWPFWMAIEQPEFRRPDA